MGAGTFPFGPNDRGVIVGAYQDPSNASVTHPFVYDLRCCVACAAVVGPVHGTFTTLDYPGAPATGISNLNNAGTIVGDWADASGVSHGFVYKHGTFTRIDAPGAGTGPNQGTIVQAISSNGVMAGVIQNDSGQFGWLLRGGEFSQLNDPNAIPGTSFLNDLSSNARYAAGYYEDANGVTHGFVATLSP